MDNHNNIKGKYKDCVRLGCNEQGIHELSVIYINRSIFACSKHKEELEKSGLVASDTNPKEMEVLSHG